MRNLIDNKLLQLLLSPTDEQKYLHYLQTQSVAHIDFSWSNLLTFIDCGNLLKDFPKFDAHNNLYNSLAETIAADPSLKAMQDMFDQIFIGFLNEVKKLTEADPTFLLILLQKKRAESSQNLQPLLNATLDKYEKYLENDPSIAKHDLILSLAWDRVCANLAILFYHAPKNPEVNQGLHFLRDCLVQSFDHIYHDGHAVPTFLKLIEALYLYQMRADIIDDQLSFNQGSFALTPYDELTSVFYIDAIPSIMDSHYAPTRVFTMDSLEQIKKRLDLAKTIIEELIVEIPDWKFTLIPLEVVHVET